MKILQINDADPYSEVGGAESYLFDLIDALKEHNELYLFTYGNDNNKNKFAVKESRFFLVRMFGKFIFSFNVFFKLRKFIKKIKPDIIHLHNNYKYSVSVLGALSKKIPIVQTIHDYGLICPSSNCILKANSKLCTSLKIIDKECYENRCISFFHFLATYFRNKLRFYLTKKKVRLFIIPSKALKESLELFGLKNTSYLPLFIKLNRFKFKKKKCKGNILYVGALTKNKGVNVLIEAMPLILKKIPRARLKIIGDGPEKKTLELLVKELNIYNEIVFLGKVGHNKIYSYYQDADVFVLPSIWMENFPVSVQEAIASGLPVVATNIGGIIDLVKDNFNGFTFKRNDAGDLARNVVNIFDDEELFAKFSLNSRKLAKKMLNKESHINNLMKLYLSVKNE